MNLSENTKRFLSIFGLITGLYVLVFIEFTLDPQTWHYGLNKGIINITFSILIVLIFYPVIRISNDFFNWNLERFAVCSCKNVKWIEGFSIIEESNLPALIKVAQFNEKDYIYDIVYTITEDGNYSSKSGRGEFREDAIIAYIPISHLTDGDKK